MSVLAVAHRSSSRPRAGVLRSVPNPPPEPLTVTISIAGGAAAGRDRVLAALRGLVDLAGPAIDVTLTPAPISLGQTALAPVAQEIAVGAGQELPHDGILRLDPRARTAQRDGEPVELSRLEYDLLLFLTRHPRQVFSRSQLLAQVWGTEDTTTTRTVDVHVSRLRTKLADPDVVTTIYGLGYRLADDATVTVIDQ